MRPCVPQALALFLLLTLPAAAQLPDSPTGRGGNKVIAMFEAGPDSVTEEFVRTGFSESFIAESSLEQRLEWLRQTVADIGPLMLRGVEKTGDFSATILARSSLTEERVEIRYQVADAAPHAIVTLVIDEGSSEPTRRLTLEEMVREAEGYLDGLSPDQFSGVVLMARGDEVLLQRAQGLASRRYQVPNDLATLFNLGSINKIFTKIAIAQLAAQGKLGFGDTVAMHLPSYPNREVAERITIQQVVTHTAGLGDIFTDEFAGASKERFRTPADYFDLFADQDLLFEPGTSQRYSNGGYMVLGAIVEAVSGQSYDRYVQENIFDPSGMTRTGSYPMDEPVHNLATGYTRQRPGELSDDDHHHDPDPDAPWRENSFLIPFTGTPAGGGYSSVGDLLRFRSALVEHRLLDPRYTAWVVTDQLPEPPPADDGFGIGVAGGAPGVNAVLEMGGEYTIVVLANQDPPSASAVARHLRQLLEAVVD